MRLRIAVRRFAACRSKFLLTMKYVLTLIGNLTDKTLNAVVAEKVGFALVKQGAITGEIDWLSKGRALDQAFDEISPSHAFAAAHAITANLPIDLYAQSITDRRKRLLIADMDSTIVAVETIDELAACVGKRDEVAAITAAAMEGELDYPASLKERTRLFAGLDIDVLANVYDECVSPNPGAHALVATMNAMGAITVLVSSGFEYFVTRVSADLGFYKSHANHLEVTDNRLTGIVAEPILDGRSKRKILEQTAREHAIGLKQILAIGDGANDVSMLDGAGLGVAYRAKPILAEHADMRIEHTDLRTLLYLQGLRDYEIIEASSEPLEAENT